MMSRMTVFFTCKLLIFNTYLSVIMSDIRIKPNVSEITLTSEADYELICAGDVPVTWNYTIYNQNLSMQKISSIDIVSKRLENIFNEHNNNYQFSSVLTLSRVSYLVTGNYYCSCSSSEVGLNDQYLKNIYLYVQHKTHLLAVPDDLNELYQNEFSEIIVPCRPTTSDVNVTLKKNSEMISNYLNYNDKRGYLLRTLWIQNGSEYSCEANKDDYNETRHFTVYINRNAVYININAVYSDISATGQNVSLNCSVTTFYDNPLILKWKLTDKQKLRDQHIEHDLKQTFFDGLKYKVDTLLLNIQNICTEDDEDYVCEVKTHSGRISKTSFNLKADESDTYLNLKIIDGEYKTVRPAGFKSVQWIIQVLAYPIASLKWVDEYGKELMTRPEKMFLEKTKNMTKLVINNLELSDSLMYKLIAENGVYEKHISVTLSVKDKPSGYIKAEDIFETYEVGKTYNFKCIMAGNPLPKIEWAFKNCSHYLECDSHTQSPVFKFINNIIYLNNSKLEVIAAVEFNVTDNGKLICKTSNELGNSIIEHTIFATDIPNNLVVKGPNNVDAGETITIECSASKHKYNDNIKWNHRTLNNGKTLMIYEPYFPYITNHTDENLIITTNQTRFSYRSYLTVRNISTKYNGVFDCTANKREQTSYYILPFTKSLNLSVVDLYAPVVYNSSNLNSTVETGEPVRLWCYARGVPSPTISWYKDNRALRFVENDKKLLLLNNNQTILITSTELEDNGSYECRASNKKGSVVSTNTLIVIDMCPVIYNSSNSSNSIIIGKSVHWWCFVRGAPQPTVSWLKDDQPLRFDQNDIRISMQDDNQTLFIYNTELEDEGTYVCNASNRFGSAISIFTLTIIDDRGERERMIFTVFYLVTAVLLGVLVSVCLMYSKRNRKFKKELALASFRVEKGAIEAWNPDLGIEEQAELLPYYREWEFPMNKLKLDEVLGAGAFGIVYKAKAIGILDKDTITTVAVKTIKQNTDQFYKKSLASELKIMIHLGKHLNIINLLGACTGNKRNLMVIVEYCRFGNIYQYLLQRRDCFINQITPDGSLDYEIKTVLNNINYENFPDRNTWFEKRRYNNGTQIRSDSYMYAGEEPHWRSNYRRDHENDKIISPLCCTHNLICWSFQVSRGMTYLASRRILHGDLAARNILLADENIVKICDFGLAKIMYNNDNYTKKSYKDLLPVKWMAIESLRDQIFSTQSDVWAFGIVLWEMFSLSVTPYPNIQSINELYNKLIEGYRMEQPKYSNSEIYNIMFDCWKENPSSRPSFNDLADRLGTLLGHGTKSHYIDLNEEYVEKNTKGSLSTDYFSLVTSPTYVNCLPKSDNNSNSSSENKDVLEL